MIGEFHYTVADDEKARTEDSSQKSEDGRERTVGGRRAESRWEIGDGRLEKAKSGGRKAGGKSRSQTGAPIKQSIREIREIREIRGTKKLQQESVCHGLKNPCFIRVPSVAPRVSLRPPRSNPVKVSQSGSKWVKVGQSDFDYYFLRPHDPNPTRSDPIRVEQAIMTSSMIPIRRLVRKRRRAGCPRSQWGRSDQIRPHPSKLGQMEGEIMILCSMIFCPSPVAGICSAGVSENLQNEPK